MPRRFRKRPIVVEAIQWTRESHEDVRAFLGTDYGGLTGEADPDNRTRRVYRLSIRTPEGWVLADDGDWIIRGVAGEHYACKPAIFDATFEALEESNG